MAPVPYGRDNQSIAFFSAAGMLPLCSGVTIRTASASATAVRSPATFGVDLARGRVDRRIGVLVVERERTEVLDDAHP